MGSDSHNGKKLEKQKSVKEITERFEENARENKQKEETNEAQKRERVQIMKREVVPLNHNSNRLSQRYRDFREAIKTDYDAQIKEQNTRNILTNQCEYKCANELTKCSDSTTSPENIGILVRQSVENMHATITDIILDNDLMVVKDKQENIESYFDNRVYDRMNALDFQGLNASARSNRKKNKEVILNALYEMITNSMNKRDADLTEASNLSASNYNPYLI